MSELFISRHQVGELKDKKNYYFWPKVEEYQLGQQSLWSGTQLLDDQEGLWQSARCDSHKVQAVVCGRLTLTAHDWRTQQSNTRLTGGTAAKWVLDKWINNRDEFLKLVNGVFAIAIFEGQHRLHLITDASGMYTLYKSNEAIPRFCSHPDGLAAWMKQDDKPCTVNLSSVAEVFATENLSAPNTLYNEIELLGAGCVHSYELSTDTETVVETHVPYFNPYDVSITDHSLDEWGERIAATLQGSMASRVAVPNSSPGLFLSAGLDSRALLFAAPDPSKIQSITLFDEVNEELKVSAQLAQLAGSHHHKIKRTPEHYANGVHSSISASGGHFSFKDAHYASSWDEIRDLGVTGMISGCHADNLIKGLGQNRSEVRYLRQSIGLDKLDNFHTQFNATHYTLDSQWQNHVDQRTSQRYQSESPLFDDNERNRIRWKRMFPIAYEADTMSRFDLMRSMSWEAVYLDREMMQITAEMSPQMQLNGVALRRAVELIVPDKAKHVINNNDGTAIGASKLSRSLRVLRRSVGETVRRRLLGGFASELATQGSWPNFDFYVKNSPIILSMWQSPSPEARDIVNEIIGEDVFSKPLGEWPIGQVALLIRIMTFTHWFDHCKQ